MIISDVLEKIAVFRNKSKMILSSVETSRDRIITVEESYYRLAVLSIKQDGLFRQAIKCIENRLFRPAHVMAWAAFIDYLHNKIAEDGLIKLSLSRPSWRLLTHEDLREQSDFHVIEAAQDIGLIRKTEKKALHGLLNRRNECAHPEEFNPGLNESLGYLSELIQRIEKLSIRKL